MFNEFIEAINIEIDTLKKSKNKKYINVEYYNLVNKINKDYYIYEIYVSEYVSKMAEDLPIQLKSVKHTLEAIIVSIDENQIIKIRTKEPLSEEIYRINMEFDPSFLLRALAECINFIKDSTNPIVESLLKKIPIDKKIKIDSSNIDYEQVNDSQKEAIKSAEEREITCIWGPPGTGKTYTLSKIIFRSYLRDEKILVLSTSNVALDQILLNLDKELFDDEKDFVLRLGNTNNKTAYRYTKDYSKYKSCTKNVVFTTLANLSLKYNLVGSFDLVVVDEASMVSLPYIFIALNKSNRNAVILGDFRQLPPISLNESNLLFKMNIYDYLDIPNKIDNNEKVPYMVMLNTQYRMTKDISELISNLFYNQLLKCGVKEETQLPLNFIDVDNSSYKDTYYSISDSSYFNPISIFIINWLMIKLPKTFEVLIVTPFRSQQNILNAIFRDREESHRRSLTVHKAQGSEADIVIFDLTTHFKTNQTDFHHFFIDEITHNLVNVAISRAKKQLYIVGSKDMLEQLSLSSPLWKQLLELINKKFSIIDILEIINDSSEFNFDKIDFSQVENFTVVDTDCDKYFLHPIKQYDEEKNLKRSYLAYEGCILSEQRKTITFRDLKKTDKLSYMALINDKIILKEDKKYLVISSEKSAKILKRVALESYIDTTEIDRVSTFTLNCEECGSNYILKYRSGLVFLQCSKCHKQKHIGKNEALLLKDLYKLRCPECNADVIPRKYNNRKNYSFYGCSNYPHCTGSISMRSLAKGY